MFLESVLLEMRAGKWDRAVEEAQSALKIHTGTGRYEQLPLLSQTPSFQATYSPHLTPRPLCTPHSESSSLFTFPAILETRLWAILVQLRYMDGDVEQVTVLRQALREVPKSGEVWCEVSN